jgi:hypothetical protein
MTSQKSSVAITKLAFGLSKMVLIGQPPRKRGYKSDNATGQKFLIRGFWSGVRGPGAGFSKPPTRSTI